MAAAGFLSRYQNGPLPYVRRRHITVNKMCWVHRWNKTFPYFLDYLENVFRRDVSEALERGLEIVESLPHVSLGGEDDRLQPVVHVADRLVPAHLE